MPSGDQESSTTSTKETRVAFGLDLGGYSRKRSALVCASLSQPNEIEDGVYKHHAFSKKPSNSNPFARMVGEEVELLAECLRHAPLYMDVPIDLYLLALMSLSVLALLNAG